MNGYVIANIDVKNTEVYKKYVEGVVSTIKKFGGEYLVRAGEFKVMEGEWKHSRTVVIKFPNYEKALECHNSKEYQAGWDLAKNTTERHMQVIEGFSTE